MFESVYNTSVSPAAVVLMAAAALVSGVVYAWIMSFSIRSSKRFFLVVSLLPLVVASVICFVSGSIGAGVAVAGTFSLIRFRSAPGTGKEIVSVFISMAIGLACGMGFPLLAALFTVILCAMYALFTRLIFPDVGDEESEKTLQITIPEDLEYAGLFDDIFERYTSGARLVRVKTTNLGSLNRLSYELRMLRPDTEKAMIDELRCRNGNLEINLAARCDGSDL